MTAGRMLVALAAAGAVACATGPGPPTGSPAPPDFVLPSPAAGVPGHVLLISVAGLGPDAHRETQGMPMLAALAAGGVVVDGVVPIAPASAQPVHASLVTGRSPAAHGIGGDHPLGEKGSAPELQREAEAIRVPALWNLTREHGLFSAAIGWPTSAGAPVDWSFPELIPARAGEASPDLLDGVATPSLLAAAREKGADAPPFGFPGTARDQLLVDLACEVLVGEAAPRLLLLRLSQTEPALRRFGPGTPEVRAAFAGADAALRRLAVCLDRAGRLSRSAWLVTGDAPVRPVHTRIQANRSLERAGLLVPAPGSRTGIKRWDAFVRGNGGSAFVYARDEEAAVLARRALVEAAEATGAFRIVSAEEMIALQTDRQAWFGLAAQPGFAFADDLRGRALVRPAAARGAAGHLGPAEAFPHRTGFVAWGAGIRVGLRVPTMHQLDVAPTVARLLGLALPGAEGRALIGLLDVPPVAAGSENEAPVVP